MCLKKSIDVLGLGSVSVDFIGMVDNWPCEGAKIPLQSFTICDGGLIGTALVAVSRLGGHACFAGKLGSSDMSRRAAEQLVAEGVDTSFVIDTDGAEPIVAFVVTNRTSGQRNIFWTRQNVHYPLPSEFPDKNWFNNTGVLLVDFEAGQAGIEAARIASEYNIPVVVDVEHNEPHVIELMAVCSHVVVSEDFARMYTAKESISDILKSLRTNEEQTVVITRGRNGCAALTSDGTLELPAFNVNTIDTTGCGDVFHGAYALAIAQQKNIYEACRFASAAAALCATRIGGREGIPNEEQLQRFIDQQIED